MPTGLQIISKELKDNIRKDYLQGISIADIAQTYGFKYPRTVYFHLQPLSKADKKAHALAAINKMED